MKANTKNTKGSSPMKKLIPAAGMLMISATMLATSTFAWFTMNKEVQVTGMEVKAKAEKGLLINEVATSGDTNWDEEAKSTANAGATLIPMSSADMSTWAHANSVAANASAKGTAANTKSDKLSSAGYEIFTLATTAGGNNLSSGKLDFIQATAAAAGTDAEANIYYKEKDGTAAAIGDNDDGAFIKYTYYVKSSSSNAITLNADLTNDGDDTLYVKEIKVSGLDKNTDGDALAHDLDKTLRVAVLPTGGSALTFAPVAGADSSYFIASAYDTSTKAVTSAAASLATGTAGLDLTGTSAVSTWTATTASNTTDGLSLATLPATTSDGAKIDVYIWFEGEDSNCNTDNIYSDLDELTVEIVFGLK
ncbi:hypothetical protein [Ruminococcus albus]|uniref:Uncharacterized protein n=1 Tax=Ruminococcus albus (strain ATCC 27210 / DSM 20455 / JCM 14654 / NCDO 2250 / 7) TaxID=697329 RepID=E6UCT1_RUMA7|nr:hypothetical protein [Ruminococcus albus]ADU22760.1 hypothetical protein Rumal_2275 [Ruminococcus albus 7 = DSM 20455]ADU24359.1 hypothetical protein Rumal_3936 [Ruminococcus albus 7 = DSM 20455]